MTAQMLFKNSDFWVAFWTGKNNNSKTDSLEILIKHQVQKHLLYLLKQIRRTSKDSNRLKASGAQVAAPRLPASNMQEARPAGRKNAYFRPRAFNTAA